MPSGKLQLRDATAELQGVAEPLQLTSATATLADQTVAISSFSAEFKDGTAVSGSASFPLRCVYPESCVLRFDLRTPEITQARLNQLMNPSYQSRPWYHLLAIGQRDENALMKLQARGRLAAGRILIGDLSASDFVSTVEMNSGKLSLKDIRADALGGHHTGNWDADFTATPPKYFGSGTVTKIAMAQVAALMPTHGRLEPSRVIRDWNGRSTPAPHSHDSASGTASFKWTGGVATPRGAGRKGTPLTFSSFDGQVVLRNGNLSPAGLQAANGRRNLRREGGAASASRYPPGATWEGHLLRHFRPVGEAQTSRLSPRRPPTRDSDEGLFQPNSSYAIKEVLRSPMGVSIRIGLTHRTENPADGVTATGQKRPLCRMVVSKESHYVWAL